MVVLDTLAQKTENWSSAWNTERGSPVVVCEGQGIRLSYTNIVPR